MWFGLKLNLIIVFNIQVLVNGKTTISYSDINVSEESTESAVSSNESKLSLDLRFPTDCQTPNEDEAFCMEIQECPKLLKQLHNKNAVRFLISSKCGPTNEDKLKPRVCCGKYDNFKNLTNNDVEDNTIFPKKCGYEKPVLRSRILGGTKASLGEFPWMARIVHKNNNGYKTVGCAAFLIHTKYVLTAGHCVSGKFVQARGPIFAVLLGEHNTETKVDCNPTGTYCAEPLQISRVAKVIVHPAYDAKSTGHYNDIALVHLNKGARMTDFVQPICLHSDQGIPDRYVISGWGKTEKALFSTVKLKLELPPVDKSTCSEKYDSLGIELIESQICAGGENQKDACSGDSGGPLMYDNGTNWIAAGVVSFGIGCGVEGWPGVYTNVSSFMPWISEQMMYNSLIASRNSHNKNKKHRPKKIIK